MDDSKKYVCVYVISKKGGGGEGVECKQKFGFYSMHLSIFCFTKDFLGITALGKSVQGAG